VPKLSFSSNVEFMKVKLLDGEQRIGFMEGNDGVNVGVVGCKRWRRSDPMCLIRENQRGGVTEATTKYTVQGDTFGASKRVVGCESKVAGLVIGVESGTREMLGWNEFLDGTGREYRTADLGSVVTENWDIAK
jgi:hypothetical protein